MEPLVISNVCIVQIFAQEKLMTRTNNLYLIIGALIIAVAGLGIYVWNEETKPKGIEMNIGPGGVSVQEN